MTWTYGGDPASNARDAIRFLIGDTDTNDQLLNDEEIAWVNNQVTGSDTATTALYEAAWRSMATNARAQAEQLKALAMREGNVPTPYAGGLTVSDKDIDRDNSNMVQPSFARGQFRDPLAGSSVRQDFGSLAN